MHVLGFHAQYTKVHFVLEAGSGDALLSSGEFVFLSTSFMVIVVLVLRL